MNHVHIIAALGDADETAAGAPFDEAMT